VKRAGELGAKVLVQSANSSDSAQIGDVEKLITRNQAYPENEVASLLSPCILCGQRLGAGIVLNDKRFVCKPCFQVVSLIE
jgi:hypothetical protein